MLMYNVSKQKLVEELAVELKKIKELTPPDWARFAKTGQGKQFPPIQKDWWQLRAASILRKIAEKGPVGVSKLRNTYGNKKNRGKSPEKFVRASGNVIRKILQQFEKAGFLKQDTKGTHKGRIITSKAEKFMNSVVKKIEKQHKPIKSSVKKEKIKSSEKVSKKPEPATIKKEEIKSKDDKKE